MSTLKRNEKKALARCVTEIWAIFFLQLQQETRAAGLTFTIHVRAIFLLAENHLYVKEAKKVTRHWRRSKKHHLHTACVFTRRCVFMETTPC